MAPRTPTAKSTMRIEPPLSHTGENMADTGTVGRFVRGRSGGAGEQRETRRTRRNEVEPSKRVREVRSKRISRGIPLPRDLPCTQRKNHHGRKDGGREILRLRLRMTSSAFVNLFAGPQTTLDSD